MTIPQAMAVIKRNIYLELSFLSRSCPSTIVTCGFITPLIQDSINNLESEYKTLQSKEEEMKNTIGYSKMAYEIGKDLKLIENNINNEDKKKNLIKNYLYSINKMKSQVGYYLNETWIKDIKSNLGQAILTKNIFRNKNYLEIYELHKRLNTIKENKRLRSLFFCL